MLAHRQATRQAEAQTPVNFLGGLVQVRPSSGKLRRCPDFRTPRASVEAAPRVCARAARAMSGQPNLDPEQAMTMAKEEVLYRVDLFNSMVSGRKGARGWASAPRPHCSARAGVRARGQQQAGSEGGAAGACGPSSEPRAAGSRGWGHRSAAPHAPGPPQATAGPRGEWRAALLRAGLPEEHPAAKL